MNDEDLEYNWIREQIWVRMEKEARENYELEMEMEKTQKPAKIIVEYDKPTVNSLPF